MKIGERIKAAMRILTKRSTTSWDEIWYNTLNIKTKAGADISETSALTISGLFAALNFLAGTLASLPRAIYRRLPDEGREPAVNHPLYDRLRNKPNESKLTAWQWIYTSIMHKYLWGNWYTLINKPIYQQQTLIPLLPDRTWIDSDRQDRYITRTSSGQQTYIAGENMLHIPHISMEGITGKGIIHYARESLGIAKAQDEFAANFFGKGTKAGGFVEIPGKMDEEIKKGLQADFNDKYGALGESWKAIFLTGGAKFTPTVIDAVKAQALESRQFSIVEVARWTNLPPHILRELSRATFSNIEHQGIELVIYSLLPITTQIESAMNASLLDEDERKTYFIKFDLKGLLRGDIAARTAFYNAMLDRGVFNADMVLALEDMNPQPNGLGKIYMLPLNMINKERAVTEESPTPDEEIQAERIRGGLEIKHEFEMERRARQLVQQRTAALRRKITIAYKTKFEAYGKKVITAEVKAIRKAIKEMLGEKGATELQVWMDRFYPTFSERVDIASAPLLTSYADAIQPVALQEIGSEVDVSVQYNRFTADYRESFVKRHVDGSKGQLRKVIKEAEEQHLDVAEALDTRLDEWAEKRPGKIANRESMRAENAFTRSVFALAGITQLISMSSGKPCPYCDELNGKVVGIEKPFLGVGDFQPEGADGPLNISSNHFHPPYHDGCECGIMAVTS